MKKRININGTTYEQVNMNESLFETNIEKGWEPLPDGPAKQIDFKGGTGIEGGNDPYAASIALWGSQADGYDGKFDRGEDVIELSFEFLPKDYKDYGDLRFGVLNFSFDDKGSKEADKVVKRIMRDLENGVAPYKVARKYGMYVDFL